MPASPVLPTAISSAIDDASRTTPAGRWTSVAGAAYVVSWLVGLAIAPAAPEPDAPAAKVGAFYAEHGPAVLTSAAFVHGTAGISLVVLALALSRATRAAGGLRRAVAGTGLTAAALSLLQVALAATAVAGDDASTSADLFVAVNVVDVLKIVVLAAFVAVATTAAAGAGQAPRWLQLLAAGLVPVLVVGSAAFLVVTPALMAVLTVSLLGLLVWAAVTAFVVARAAR